MTILQVRKWRQVKLLTHIQYAATIGKHPEFPWMNLTLSHLSASVVCFFFFPWNSAYLADSYVSFETMLLPKIFFFLIEVELIYNVLLVSGVQHRNSVYKKNTWVNKENINIYKFFFRFLPLIGYDKILSIMPCAIQ